MNLNVAHLDTICRWAHFNVKLHFLPHQIGFYHVGRPCDKYRHGWPVFAAWLTTYSSIWLMESIHEIIIFTPWLFDTQTTRRPWKDRQAHITAYRYPQWRAGGKDGRYQIYYLPCFAKVSQAIINVKGSFVMEHRFKNCFGIAKSTGISGFQQTL